MGRLDGSGRLSRPDEHAASGWELSRWCPASTILCVAALSSDVGTQLMLFAQSGDMATRPGLPTPDGPEGRLGHVWRQQL